MKITYTPRALLELGEIAEYIKNRSPVGALRVRSAILATLENLSKFPNIGRRQTVEPIRKIGVRRYPYLIYYIVEHGADEVVVISIQHASRDREFCDQ